ncbi:predicted protein [Histoplasma mississippiense (nom. inval.)]|uniref:predicted protein n=1 Tax=Ajellomyces capsulatus (strain NAm1 / WU24) TaxID=2059318 RepID=UPI000157B70F|nr:predicted protein [Histoplasma mississippiense (nom. inval.)]EDN04086.1 predicted protein [Histoplasma mississippiense (nom. inval.)]
MVSVGKQEEFNRLGWRIGAESNRNDLGDEVAPSGALPFAESGCGVFVSSLTRGCASAQERPYTSRPSRTQQLANPKLVPELMSDVPNDLLRTKGVADEQLALKERERGRNREDSDYDRDHDDATHRRPEKRLEKQVAKPEYGSEFNRKAQAILNPKGSGSKQPISRSWPCSSSTQLRESPK